MNRDFDQDSPEIPHPETRDEVRREPEQAPKETPLSREHQVIPFRGHAYRLSAAERESLYEIGRFRTVAIEDLKVHQYRGKKRALQGDLHSLQSQGLVQIRSVWAGPHTKKLPVIVLTKQGKELVHHAHRADNEQDIYSGFVKAREARHDAAIYRMFQAERQKIERAGGRIRRIVLDYELKKKVYSPLAKAKHLPPLEYARRQMEVARQNGLTVVGGKIPLPDLRIEYETADGQETRVDLELATGHYHGRSLAEKVEAGFKMYAADGSGSRLSRVLEEREITASIFSL